MVRGHGSPPGWTARAGGVVCANATGMDEHVRHTASASATPCFIENPPLVGAGIGSADHGAESKMVGSGADVAFAAGAHHVARAVLIGAEKRSAALYAFVRAGFVGIE